MFTKVFRFFPATSDKSQPFGRFSLCQKRLADFFMLGGKSFQWSPQIPEHVFFYVTILSDLYWPWENLRILHCLVNPVNANLDSVSIFTRSFDKINLVPIYRISPISRQYPWKKHQVFLVGERHALGENHQTSMSKQRLSQAVKKSSCLLKYFFTKHHFLN